MTHPEPPHFENFTDLLCWRAVQHPEALAFRYFPDGETETHRLSYAELDQQARRLGAYLHQKGFHGARLLLLYPPDLHFITAFVGCLYAGAIPVPAYPPEPHRLQHTRQRLHHIVKDAQATGILTLHELASQAHTLFAEHPQLEWIHSDQLPRPPVHWSPPSQQSHDIAFLQYTSGSTSDPKGVMITHHNLLSNQAMIKVAFAHEEQSARLVCWVPFYHDMGLVGHLLQSLYVGGETLIMPPTAFLKKPVRWLRLIHQFQATSTGAPNFAYDLCVRKITPEECQGLDLSSLRMALNGAEPVQADTLQRFVKRFEAYGLDKHTPYPAYGMAEATVFISGGRREERPFYLEVERSALAEHRIVVHAAYVGSRPEDLPALPPEQLCLVSSGRAWQETTLQIVDPHTGAVLEDGYIGEIWVKGPQVAAGYWNRPDTTAASFIDGFCHTGDLGFLYQEQLFVTGRLKDLIIIRGRNIYPQDIERSVDHWPAVAPEEPMSRWIRPGCGVACADSGNPGHDRGEQIVFLQEVHPQAPQNPTELQALRQALQIYLSEVHQLPIHEVVLLAPGSLPKTSSGKLMRSAAQQAYQQQFQHSGVSPLLPLHSRLHREDETVPQQAFTRATAAETLDTWLLHWLQHEIQWPHTHLPEANFQALGLDSLLAVRLVADLEQKTHRQLPETLLWDYPTPKKLLGFLRASTTKTATPPEGSDRVAQALHEPIAIIGMSCRFPGGIQDPESFWQALASGKDCIQNIPQTDWRWPHEAFYMPHTPGEPPPPGKTDVQHGGFLERVFDFDPAFFHISPKEAQDLDPQQRLLLNLSWEALNSAGLRPEAYEERLAGVFLGLSNLDYSQWHIHSGHPDHIGPYSGTGVSPSTAAGRIAYTFGFQGPVMTLDTACSGSLVAVHQACQSLRLGEAELALAGGVNLILSPEGHLFFSQLQALAPDGRCKAFAADANGFVRSEGGGLVVLQPLAAAQREGRRILGLILGSAVNHNGASNGLTAPSTQAQQQVIQKALQQAATAPHDVDFIEAHGTGTALGDPIEIEAIHQAYRVQERQHPLYVGAVKTQLGHTESAAGIAGLLKSLLMLHHQHIPANLHGEEPNPRLPVAPALVFPQQLTSAPLRKIGISSFGISGTNAHLVLAAPPVPEPLITEPHAPQTLHPVFLTAHTQATLKARLQQFQQWLSQRTEAPLQSPDFLADLCWRLQQEQEPLSWRWGSVVQDLSALQQDLEASLAQEGVGTQTTPSSPIGSPKTVFVFPGQGGQWLGMGQELYAQEPVFREIIDTLETQFSRHTGALPAPLSTLIQEASDLQELPHIQAVLFAYQVALAHCWIARGITPQAVVGHSMGEVAAAYIAGGISLEDAVHIMVCRSRLLAQPQLKGAMLVTALSPEAAQAQVEAYSQTVVGVYNSPQASVLSGPAEDLSAIAKHLESEGVFCRLAQVRAASHTPAIEDIQNLLLEQLHTVKGQALKIPMCSSVTGTWLDATPLDAAYWYANLRQPVQFMQAASQLLQASYDVWVEMSPHPVLAPSIKENAQAQARSVQVLIPARRQQAERQTLWQSLLTYQCLGGSVRWSLPPVASDPHWQLPPYPWQGQHYERQRPSPQAAQGPTEEKTNLTYNPSVAQESPLPLEPELWHRAWEKSPLPPMNPSVAPADWLIFCDDPALRWSLEMMLQGQQQNCIWVQRGHDLQLKHFPLTLDPTQPQHFQALVETLQQKQKTFRGVIFAWGASESHFSSEQATQHYLHLLYWLQAMESLPSPPRLYVLSQGQLNTALWSGLIHTAFYEYPQWHCTHIDIGDNTHALQMLATELFSDNLETQVVLRTERYVARLKKGTPTSEEHYPFGPAATPAPSWKNSWPFKKNRPAPTKAVGSWQVRPDAQYLISGGLGLLGFHTAQWLVEQGARYLTLMGRHLQPTAEQQQQLTRWQNAGVHVQLFQGNVAQEADLQACFRQMQQGPPLRGIVHSAGVLQDGLIHSQQSSPLKDHLAVLAPKVNGTWLLHTLSQQLPEELDFFVCYSSITAPLGMPGQGNYAAANGFMDHLMAWRQHQGLAGTSIQWGPWERPGFEGVQTRDGRALLGQYGFSPITLNTGLRFLPEILRSQASTAAVMGLRLQRLLKAFPHTRYLPLLRRLAQQQELSLPLEREPRVSIPPQRPQSTPGVASAVPEETVSSPDSPNPESLRLFLHHTVAEILGLPPGQINLQSPLRGYGFDSLMALELKAQLQNQYGLTLQQSERSQSMTLEEMTERLCFPERFQATDNPEPED